MSELQFDGQRKGENLVFIFRRHILTARKGLIFMLIMTALGMAPLLLWPGNSYMFWVFLGCIFIGVLGLIYAYMMWYFSIYIVTDQRLRQISQKGLWKKTVVDLGIDKIQSISYQVPGFFGGIFGYGTILVQTAVGDLIISNVSKPEKVYNKLQNVTGKVNHGNSKA
ncbi:PH domain-containing protein [Candidatus Saccharibacteria bacterium]|jgi:uncharacterized membrane protein YdbT with pleckstrin-like domain|nr:PH domain-containing protein [Candidatus Saccharibacteria bacterium]